MKKIYISLIIAFTAILNLQAATYTVGVSNNVFTPDNFTVNVGDTVMWTWVSGNHTTTSTNVPLGAASWDNAITQNEPVFIYVVTVAGTYDYRCTFHYMMGMIGHFTATQSSGLPENTAGVHLEIFANPVSKELQVDLQTIKSGEMLITLNDITGREVKLLASAYQSAGEHHMQYSLAGLPKGVYLFKLTLSNDNIVRKIIVQ